MKQRNSLSEMPDRSLTAPTDRLFTADLGPTFRPDAAPLQRASHPNLDTKLQFHRPCNFEHPVNHLEGIQLLLQDLALSEQSRGHPDAVFLAGHLGDLDPG